MKAVLSNVNLINRQDELANEFYSHINDLMDHPLVLKMDDYSQHLNTSRLQHSLNVAYYSFLFARKLNLNVRDAVRGALLHDLFLYEWRTEQPVAGNHVLVHPMQALQNAHKVTHVTPVMEDVIASHMWPVGNVKPKTSEGWLIQMVDKMCAVMEISVQSSKKIERYNFSPILLGLLFYIN
jgi:uncharacterized protein